MQPLDEIYKGSFFARRDKLSWRVPIICNILQKVFDLKMDSSIIDVGCATGDLVKEFQNRGLYATGIEGSANAINYYQTNTIFPLDLRKKISSLVKYDLCTCIEVAEHIEEEYSDIFIKNLTEFSQTILITAAKPGQRGHYHVNCQPAEYWLKKFNSVGYQLDGNLTNQLKAHFKPYQKKKGLSTFYLNSMVFKKTEGELI